MLKVLAKSEDTTDPDYGCRPDKRPIEQLLNAGIVNLDKPRGPTSHQVAAWVKDILGIKTGHGGTLDPAVSGVLPVFLGSATRLADLMLLSSKEYVCLMRLHGKVAKKDVTALLKQFQGKIYQKPPVKSAVKRKLRIREIYGIDLLEIDDNSVLFKIRCEAGTYIRKYCHDFGLLLGTGAHMQELRRVKSGEFKEDEDLVTLQDLKDAFVFWKEGGDERFLRRCVLPMESAVKKLPKVWIRDSAIDSLCHGSDLAVPGVVKMNEFEKGALIAVMSLKGELVALGDSVESAKDIMRAKKGFVIKTSKVFMGPGVYPKNWKKEAGDEVQMKSAEKAKTDSRPKDES